MNPGVLESARRSNETGCGIARLACVLAALSCTAVRAQDSASTGELVQPELQPSASHRPGVGLLAGAGLHTGLALGARVGLGDLGVEVTGGYQLLLAVWEDELESDSSELTEIDAGSSAQLGAEVYWTPWHPLPSSAIGLKVGYRYNTVLHHGAAVAITFLVSLSPSLALEGLAGAQFFPRSEDRLRNHLDLPRSADLIYSSSTQFFEYGFELIWYPWH